MKIVDRKTFLALPAGTVYVQAGVPFAFGDIKVKQETTDNNLTGDWFQFSLTDIDASGSDELFDRWNQMLNEGASFPLDLETIGRDGLFEADAIFMVYEKADLEKLRDLFTDLAAEAKDVD